MKHFIFQTSWRVIPVRNLPFGAEEFRVIGYVSTMWGLAGSIPAPAFVFDSNTAQGNGIRRLKGERIFFITS